MSDKRFVKDMLNIVDVLTNKAYTYEFEEDLDKMLDLLNEQQDTISALKEENEQLRKENTALDNENAEHLADNIRELELLEKLTKFLHECDLTNEQRALFRDMITEEDLQPNLEVEK